MNPSAMETLSEAINRLREAGFCSSWTATAGGQLTCSGCGDTFSAREAKIAEIVRFEGNSDPGDASILFALVGREHRGVYLAAFGPDVSIEDAEIAPLLADGGRLLTRELSGP